MINTEEPVIELNASDRCDGCGAQAYSLATHNEHSELLFCIHHRKSSIQNLLDEGWTVIDDFESMQALVS